jgi:pimeloyl-ACP methyl ester carboxylesterase
MKTVLFVPGFREDINSRDYKSALSAIKSKGYKVKFVPINWSKTTIDDWTKELNKVYSKYNSAETILAGFSFGSMTAFMASVSKNPSELWLFSFSPYFSDDMPDMKKSWLSYIGHRRTDSFRRLDFNTLAKSIKCKTLILVGEVEARKYPLLDKRSKLAHQKITNSRLVLVNGAGHDISDKNYIASIVEAI